MCVRETCLIYNIAQPMNTAPNDLATSPRRQSCRAAEGFICKHPRAKEQARAE